MQSSPYHSNKLFDGKLNLLNVPKSSKNCAWKLVKDIDEKTGSFVYKLVNNEIDNKLIHTKINLMKEAEKVKEEKPPTTEEVKEPKENLLHQEGRVNYPVTCNKTETTEEKPVEENIKTPVTEKIIKENVLISEYLLENSAQLTVDFSTFRAKYRNYIFSCFDNNIVKVNSKDISKLLEYSRILDYRKGYLTKIDQAIISIQGECENNFDNLHTLFSFKFLKKKNERNEIYYYNSNRLEVKNVEGRLFQQFVANINSYLPTSESNIFNYIPNVQFFNESKSMSPMNLIIKIILKIQKVPIDSINESEIQYLLSDN